MSTSDMLAAIMADAEPGSDGEPVPEPLVADVDSDKLRRRLLTLTDKTKIPDNGGITNQTPVLKQKVGLDDCKATDFSRDICVLATRVSDALAAIAENVVSATDVNNYFANKLQGFEFDRSLFGDGTNWTKKLRVRILLALRIFVELPEGNPIASVPMPIVVKESPPRKDPPPPPGHKSKKPRIADGHEGGYISEDDDGYQEFLRQTGKTDATGQRLRYCPVGTLPPVSDVESYVADLEFEVPTDRSLAAKVAAKRYIDLVQSYDLADAVDPLAALLVKYPDNPDRLASIKQTLRHQHNLLTDAVHDHASVPRVAHQRAALKQSAVQLCHPGVDQKLFYGGNAPGGRGGNRSGTDQQPLRKCFACQRNTWNGKRCISGCRPSPRGGRGGPLGPRDRDRRDRPDQRDGDRRDFRGGDRPWQPVRRY